MKSITSVTLLILLSFMAKAQYNDTIVPSSFRDSAAHKKHRRGKDYFGIRIGYLAGFERIDYPKESSLTQAVKHGFSVGISHYYLQKHLMLLQEVCFTSQGGAATTVRQTGYGVTYKDRISNNMLCLGLKALFGGKYGGFVFYGGPLLASQLSQSYQGIDTTLSYRKSTDVLIELTTGVGYEMEGKSHKHAITFDVQFNQAVLPTYTVFRDATERYKGSYYDRSLVLLMGFRF